jgi:hypothetical protein
VVVHGTADPVYTLWRIISPAGFNVFAQTDLAAPNAAIELVLYQVDQLSDSVRQKFRITHCSPAYARHIACGHDRDHGDG